MGFWDNIKTDFGYGTQKGADGIRTAASDALDYAGEKIAGKSGNLVENVGVAVGGGAEIAKPFWKAGTWLTKKTAIVGLLAGVGVWAYGKNEEKNREAQNTLRQANLDAMEAQTAALSARADQSVLGDEEHLCGLPKVEGEQVARLGRSSGGKNNVLDFVQPTPDVAKGAVTV
jgi:hypothetical protein